jgi:hypothetical protein
MGQQGVTAVEFAEMCEARMTYDIARRPFRDSMRAFLDRCCEIGLLRREEERGTVRYLPTEHLAQWVELTDDFG